MAFIEKRSQRVVDRINFGKNLSYKFPIPFNERNQDRVLRVHDIVVNELTPKQRSNMSGKEFAKHVSIALELSSEDLRNLQRKGIFGHEEYGVEEDVGTFLSEVLTRYVGSFDFRDGVSESRQEGNTIRLSHIHRYLNSTGDIAVEAFGREQVRAYKEWRRWHRRPTDYRKGPVQRDTINHEIDLLRRALRWAERAS